jgi:hypothetical protein
LSKILIAGCSYVHKLQFVEQINKNQYCICGSGGAGNQAIAARVIYELSRQQFDRVIVLWSGVNRLDMPVPLPLHKTFDYNFFDVVGNIAWYHSGGIGCSGQSADAPRLVKQYFDILYLGANQEYFSDVTLRSILSVQTLLKAHNIPYKMCFIYDVHNYQPSQHEVSHGTLSKTSLIYSQIDWSAFGAEPPWEWAKTRNLLDHTEYYPTRDAFFDWFKEQMNIDLIC